MKIGIGSKLFITSGVTVTLGVAASAAILVFQPPRLMAWLLVTAAAALGLVIAYAVSRGIADPLGYLAASARRAAHGDVTERVELEDRPDELGELARSLNSLYRSLREIVGALREAGALLARAVDNVDGSTSAQGEVISRQAQALHQTQVTAQEIKQTSALAAEKTAAVIEVASRAEGIGRSGASAIESSLGGLGDIRTHVAEMAKRIGGLGEQARRIGAITQSVKDLADQSNMLALNAAIEAVRSGEHGKGFAVVAREIRALADQSIEATGRARDVLDSLRGGIATTVTMTETGVGRIEAGLVQLTASGENLRELSRIVKDSSDAVRQIAAAVSQQNSGIEEIFVGVTEQNRMMDETLKRLEVTADSVKVLRDVAERVDELAARYKV